MEPFARSLHMQQGSSDEGAPGRRDLLLHINIHI